MTVFSSDLRPMSTGDMLDRTIRLYRRHFLHVLGIAAVPYILWLPIIVWLDPARGGRLTLRALQDPAVMASAALLGLAAIWLYFLSMGALARSVSEFYLGRESGVWASYRPVLRRTFPLLWAYFLSVLVWGGVLAAGIALPLLASTIVVTLAPGPWGIGIYALFAIFIITAVVTVVVTFFRLLLVTQVVVLEDLRGPAALQRSWMLMRRNAWRAVVIFLFGLIVSVILGIVCGLFVALLAGLSPTLKAGAPQLFADYLARVLATPLLSIPFTLLYYDSRIRIEGFDLEVMAQNLGVAPDSVAASPVTSPRASVVPPSTSAAHEAQSAGQRQPSGGLRVCPKCGTQLPRIQLTCWKCGTRASYRPGPYRSAP